MPRTRSRTDGAINGLRGVSDNSPFEREVGIDNIKVYVRERSYGLLKQAVLSLDLSRQGWRRHKSAAEAA